MLTIRKTPLDEIISDSHIPSVGSVLTPAQCKSLAVKVAYRGLGAVSPNPLVGAVVVDEQHRLLATGAHLRCGDAHAEVNALAELDDDRDLGRCTMYVTLEPCMIDGRTPACAPQLAKRGLGKVVVGSVDPHPDVNGRGLQFLRDAGVAVEHDQAWDVACADLAEVFFFSCHHDRPFVAVKVAAGVDGNMARPGHQRHWITGTRARQYGHFLRCYYDAIMVGVNTVLADDPLLDARGALTARRDPVAVVLDPQARLAGHEPKLFASRSAGTLWVVGADAGKRAESTVKADHVKVLTVASPDGRMHPDQILRVLKGQGLASLLLEGGATTIGRFASAGFLDKIHLFQAASALGGPNVLNWSGAAPGEFACRFELPVLTTLGEDWMIEMRQARED